MSELKLFWFLIWVFRTSIVLAISSGTRVSLTLTLSCLDSPDFGWDEATSKPPRPTNGLEEVALNVVETGSEALRLLDVGFVPKIPPPIPDVPKPLPGVLKPVKEVAAVVTVPKLRLAEVVVLVANGREEPTVEVAFVVTETGRRLHGFATFAFGLLKLKVGAAAACVAGAAPNPNPVVVAGVMREVEVGVAPNVKEVEPCTLVGADVVVEAEKLNPPVAREACPKEIAPSEGAAPGFCELAELVPKLNVPPVAAEPDKLKPDINLDYFSRVKKN